MIEARFPVEYRDEPNDEPGLVLGDDGVVYIVKADGSRVAADSGGGSGSSAVTITTDEQGKQVAVSVPTGWTYTIEDENQMGGIAYLSDYGGSGTGAVSLSNGENASILVGTDTISVSAPTIELGLALTGFFGVPGTAQPAAPASAQDIADALAELGLVAAGGVITGEPLDPIHLIGALGEPGFENGWQSYNTVNQGTNRVDPGFRKDRGRVYLQGVFAGGSPPSTVFHLPAGYFDPGKILVLAATSNPGNQNGAAIVIQSDGAVVMDDVIAGYYSLDGFSFNCAAAE